MVFGQAQATRQQAWVVFRAGMDDEVAIMGGIGAGVDDEVASVGGMWGKRG